MKTSIAPWVALSIAVIMTSVAYVAVSFIESGAKVRIISPLQIDIGKEPPVIHIHKSQFQGA